MQVAVARTEIAARFAEQRGDLARERGAVTGTVNDADVERNRLVSEVRVQFDCRRCDFCERIESQKAIGIDSKRVGIGLCLQ